MQTALNNIPTKFDIRGKYGVDIFDKDSFFIAKAVQKLIPLQKILIGWDSRPISKNLALNFISGLENKVGIQIEYMPECPIEYVTVGANTYSYDFSVMFTGSHNPYDWTGLLMHTKGGSSVQGELMKNIISEYEKLLDDEYNFQNPKLENYIDVTKSIENIYTDKIKKLVDIDSIKKFKIVVDCSDGTGSKCLTLFEKLFPQINVVRLNDRNLYDVNTAHIADPSNIECMKDLLKYMDNNLDTIIGFAFDSDADRILAIDDDGNYLNGSILGGIISNALRSIVKKDEFNLGYAVECGLSIKNANIENKGLNIYPIPVGRSVIREMLRKEKLDFGVENVGHFYYKDFFQTDSSIFSIILILLWLSKGNKFSQVLFDYPDGYRGQGTAGLSSPLNLNKEKLIEEISSTYTNTKKYYVDGVRIEIYNGEKMTGWFSVRQSGYEKIIKYYYGSADKKEFQELNNILQKYIY